MELVIESRKRRTIAQLNLYLDRELYEQFKNKCKSEGYKLNAVAEALIKLYLQPDTKVRINGN